MCCHKLATQSLDRLGYDPHSLKLSLNVPVVAIYPGFFVTGYPVCCVPYLKCIKCVLLLQMYYFIVIIIVYVYILFTRIGVLI